MLLLLHIISLQFLLAVIISNTTCLADVVQVKLVLFKTCLVKGGVPSQALVPRSFDNSSHYAHLNSHQWISRIPTIYPLAYFLPKSTSDVQVAVRCGSTFKLQLIPKSGGHSYEEFSYGDSDTIVIDLQKMKQIQVNPEEGTAVVGAGALAGEIYDKTWREAQSGVPMSECMNVGIGGMTLGGGYSPYANLYGLTSDNVLEFTMVDAVGERHEVTASRHADLFWAFRGVGSGYFGIVTKFKFKMFKASTLKHTTVLLVYNSKSSLKAVVAGWQEWIIWSRQNEPTVNADLNVTSNQVAFLGIFVQDSTKLTYDQDTSNFLKAVKKIFPPPDQKSITTTAFMPYLKQVAEPHYEVPNTLVPPDFDIGKVRSYKYGRYYFDSTNFYVDKYFDQNSLGKIAQILSRVDSGTITINFSAFGTAARCCPLNNETAFVHRNAFYSVTFRVYKEQRDADTDYGTALVTQILEEMKFMDNGQSYQNTVDAKLKDYLQRYYATNLPRLVQIKSKWDPGNYFSGPQSVPTSIP